MKTYKIFLFVLLSICLFSCRKWDNPYDPDADDGVEKIKDGDYDLVDVFTEDFSNNLNKWYTGSYDEYLYTDISSGNYNINNTNSSAYYLTRDIEVFNPTLDFAIETSISMQYHANEYYEYGLMWNVNGINYFFLVNGYGKIFIGYYNESFYSFYNDYCSYISVDENDLSIIKYKGQIGFFVNNQLVYKTESMVFSNKGIGFRVYDANVSVDYLYISQIIDKKP